MLFLVFHFIINHLPATTLCNTAISSFKCRDSDSAAPPPAAPLASDVNLCTVAVVSGEKTE